MESGFLIGAVDGRLVIWETEEYSEYATLECPYSIHAVCFTADARTIVTACGHYEYRDARRNATLIVVWKFDPAERSVERIRHKSVPEIKVSYLAISGTGDALWGVWDHKIFETDPSTLEVRATYEGNQARISGLATSQCDGANKVISTAWDATVREHSQEQRSGRMVATCSKSSCLSNIAGQKFAFVVNMTEIAVYSYHDYDCIMTIYGNSAKILALRLNSDGTRLVASGADVILRVWDISGTAARMLTEIVAGFKVLVMSMNHSGNRIVAADRSELIAWSVDDSSELFRRRGAASENINTLEHSFPPVAVLL
jgi:WD40 repeat protein